MKRHSHPYFSTYAAILACLGFTFHAHGTTVTLALAQGFGALVASTFTNTRPTIINGNIGVSTRTAIPSFPPGTATTLRSNDAVSQDWRIR